MPLSDDQTQHIQSGLASLVNLLVTGHFDAFVTAVGGSTPFDLGTMIDGLGAPLVRTPTAERDSVSFTAAADDAGSVEGVMPLWTADGPTGVGIRFVASPSPLAGFWDYTVAGIAEVAKPDPGLADREPAPAPAVRSERPPRKLAERPVPARWRPALAALVDRLVAGDYAGLAADGLVWFTDDPTDTSVGDFIEMYPDTLVPMPSDGWKYTEHDYNVQDDGSWSAYVPLWTTNESPSDLTMEAVVWDDGVSVTAKISMVHAM